MAIPYSPARVASQIAAQVSVPEMIAKCTVGCPSMESAIDWAASELEGFSRS